MAQLHLADAEPEPVDAAAKVQIQMRRRVFWSAYALDRAVGTAFDLAFSVPDYQITVKFYANINDYELDERCAEAIPEDLQIQPRFTSVSYALHVIYCRQIQSVLLSPAHFDKRLLIIHLRTRRFIQSHFFDHA